MLNCLRSNKIAMAILTVLRVYLGYQWLSSGFGKITGDTAFSAGGLINNIVANPVTGPDGNTLYPVYNWFIETFAAGNVELFSFLVMWGEFLVGLGLIVGLFTKTAVFFGMVMNFAFLFGGTVSVNPLYILIGFFIIVGGQNVGKIGLDFYFRKFIASKAKSTR